MRYFYYFPPLTRIYRAKYNRMLNLLRQVSNDVTFKVLIQPSEDVTKEPIQEELKQTHRQIDVQSITKSLQSKIMIVVVDQATSVAVEVKDDSNKTFKDASADCKYWTVNFVNYLVGNVSQKNIFLLRSYP